MFSICVWVILLTRNSSNCFNQRNPIIIPTILVGVDFESSHDLGSLKCFPMLQVEITSVIMLHTPVLTCSEESEGCFQHIHPSHYLVPLHWFYSQKENY